VYISSIAQQVKESLYPCDWPTGEDKFRAANVSQSCRSQTLFSVV